MSNNRRLKSRFLFLPVVFILAVLLGAIRYWHAVKTSPGRQFQAAVAAFAQNDLDRVQVAAEGMRGVDGYESHLRLLSGMVLLRHGQLPEAIVEFGCAREHPDTRALAYALSGEALFKLGQFKDAQRILATAIQLDPAQTDAHRWLAALYYDTGAMNHAIGHLRLVAEQAPADPRPHRLIGLIHKDFEEYSKAIDAYRESYKRDPEQPDREALLLELAECLVKQRHHSEALETLDDCPRSAQALWLRAKCCYDLGDRADASKLVDEAIVLDAEHLEAMHLKGMLELEAGDAASAVDVLLKTVERYPKEWRPRYTLARAYRQLGETDKAAEHMKAMEELRELRYQFTKLHAEAIKDTENAELRYRLGVMAGELGRPLLAIGWFESALALDPEHKKAREALQGLTTQSSKPPPVDDGG